jgi:hypothetical protein
MDSLFPAAAAQLCLCAQIAGTLRTRCAMQVFPR